MLIRDYGYQENSRRSKAFPYAVQTENRREDFFSRFSSLNLYRPYYPALRPDYLPESAPHIITISIHLTVNFIENEKVESRYYIIRYRIRVFGNPNYTDPTGEWAIGIGFVISWDEQHGWGFGVGAALDFSKEIGIGTNFSVVNYQDYSTTYSAGAQAAITAVAFSAKAGLGISYNTKSGTNFYTNAGISISGVGVEMGTNQYWDTSGNYIGGMTNAKAFVGDVFSNVGVGMQVGTGAYEGQTGTYMEAEAFGASAQYGWFKGGDQFTASAAGFSMISDKNGTRLTGFKNSTYFNVNGYQDNGQQKYDYSVTNEILGYQWGDSGQRFSGAVGSFLNLPRYFDKSYNNYVRGD